MRGKTCITLPNPDNFVANSVFISGSQK
ncbi:hypothetical protein [Gimesia maris]